MTVWQVIIVVLLYVLIGVFFSYAITDKADGMWVIGWFVIVLSLVAILPFIGMQKLGHYIYTIIHNG